MKFAASGICGLHHLPIATHGTVTVSRSTFIQSYIARYIINTSDAMLTTISERSFQVMTFEHDSSGRLGWIALNHGNFIFVDRTQWRSWRYVDPSPVSFAKLAFGCSHLTICTKTADTLARFCCYLTGKIYISMSAADSTGTNTAEIPVRSWRYLMGEA